ncbi:MAG: abortive infection family protein [Synergistales bacterium]|nr:abortive infection family protein [Synergistales bacterium]
MDEVKSGAVLSTTETLKKVNCHGKGLDYVPPKPYHAKLGVNAAGTIATFLLEVFLGQTRVTPGA